MTAVPVPHRSSSCPSEEVLEAIATGATEDRQLLGHLEACQVCRGRVDEIRQNNRFLAQVRAAETPDPDPALAAELVPGYHVLGEIHRGGQGVVYKAVQNETRRKVALKILLPGRLKSTRQRLRFEQEIALAASLRHPNIVLVFDSVHPRDGRLGYAMEYVRGRPLDDWARGMGATSVPSLEEKLRLFIKVCEAVQYAHRRGIIHRDLKPGNILVDSDGEPRLCDFGVAKIIAGDAPPTLTGEFVGTLAYASPEQVTLSPDQVDTRSDAYALGVILYELITGALPYPVDGPVSEIVRSITTVEPRRPADIGVRLRTDLETIILRSLAKEPERRYQSAQALADDTRRFLAGDAIEARRSSGLYVLRKTARRHWPTLAVAASFLALVTGFAVVSRVQASRLAVALSLSSVDRARGLVQLGNVAEAERLLWTELLAGPHGVERWDPRAAGLTPSRAWWALAELYQAHPCALSTPVAAASVSVLLPQPERADRLLIGDASGTLALWSLPDLTRLRSVSLPGTQGARGTGGIRAAEFTGDGAIVTYDFGAAVRRWDAATLAPLADPFDAPGRDGFVAAFSPDGRLLGTGDASVIRVLDARTGRILEEVPHAFEARYQRCAFSPDGRTLVFPEPGVLRIQPLGGGQSRRIPVHSWQNAEHIVFRCDGERVYFAAAAAAFAVGIGESQAAMIGERPKLSKLNGLAASPDGALVATAGEDRRISVWDAASPRPSPTCEFAGHAESILRVAFSGDGRSLLSADFAGTLKQWDLPGPARRGAFLPVEAHRATVFAVAAAPDGRRAYSAGIDGEVKAWNLADGALLAASVALGGTVDALALPPDGGTVLACVDAGDNGDIVWLHPLTLEVVRRLPGAHGIRAPDAAFSPDGRTLASAGDEGLVRFWNASTLQRTAQHEAPLPGSRDGALMPIRTIRFSPDGRQVAWGGMGGVLSLADAGLASPARTLEGPRNTVRCLRFSPDGRILAATGDDFFIGLWETRSGRRVRELVGHSGYTFSLGFGAGGRVLASCSADGTVRLWDAESGANLAILRDARPEGVPALYTLAFTPEGDRVIVGGATGYLGVWDLRHTDRHIAGNLEYWADRLAKEGRSGAHAGEARGWARRVRGGGE